MEHRPIMDAGPGLNFFSANQERLLFATLGSLCMPAIVRDEILGKARGDGRFRTAERVLGKVPDRLLEILSDDSTPALERVVQRIARMPFATRMPHPQDLGETMVLAHAVVAAETGQSVTVLIDDGPGRQLVTAEIRRLRRMSEQGQSTGQLRMISTLTVLEKAAGGDHLPDRNTLRSVYQRLSDLDDGLVSLEQTGLLRLECWSSS